MRAAVYYGERDVRIEDRARPRPATGELLVRVSLCGICGTDAGEFAHGPRLFPLEARHPASGHLGPMTMGHEFVGRVEEIGAGVGEDWLGRRVASGAGVSCGSCAWCVAGRTNLCASYWTVGLNADGGLAEYVRVPAATCVVIADDCKDEAAALAQPLAVGLHAARRTKVQPSDAVVLIGAGAIGSFVVAALSATAPRALIAIDVDRSRLDSARALGASHVVDARSADIKDVVAELTDGRGADVVIEATGASGGAQRAIDLAARGGRMLQLGLPPEPQPLDLAAMTLREIDIRTSAAHVCAQDLPAALDLLTTRGIASLLLDRVVPLERVVSDGLEAMLGGTARGKILVDPHA